MSSAEYDIFHGLCDDLYSGRLRERTHALSPEEAGSLNQVREHGTPGERNTIREILNDILQVGKNPDWFE